MKQLLAILILLTANVVYGQTLPEFTLTDAVTGKSVSLSDYKSFPGIVVIFSSNTCAYDEYYHERISTLASAYQEKVPVLLVNPHRDNDESTEAMKLKAGKLSLTIRYLVDKEQTLMKHLKATKSPEAFVLKNSGGQFSVFYRGAIDDNPQVEADVRSSYLKDAINALLSGQKNGMPEVRPVGCTIRK